MRTECVGTCERLTHEGRGSVRPSVPIVIMTPTATALTLTLVSAPLYLSRPPPSSLHLSPRSCASSSSVPHRNFFQHLPLSSVCSPQTHGRLWIKTQSVIRNHSGENKSHCAPGILPQAILIRDFPQAGASSPQHCSGL